MGILAIVIKKVAEQASKVVLFGALVGGVSLASYATETPVGPTIEKAQLETVDINLDAVVAAITKTDPDWVKGLPQIKSEEKVLTAKNTTQAMVKWSPTYNALGNITGWQNVNDQVEGSDYACEGSERICTALFPQDFTPTASTPIPSNAIEGQYTPEQ